MPGADVQTYVSGPPQELTLVGDLAAWVDDFRGVATISTSLAATAFIPQTLRVYRDPERLEGYDAAATAAQVTAAILTGRELGLDPMASLRSIDIIKGTPALRAVALRGILQARGHSIWVDEATAERATVCGQRKGDSHVQQITWTMADARTRGLAGRPVWRAAPRNMLIARATSDVARLVAADALLGIPYTVEELQDADLDGGEPEPPAPTPRKARRAPIINMTTTRQPEAENPPAATGLGLAGETQGDPAPALISPSDATAIRRALSAIGMDTARRQMEWVIRTTGRPVDRLADLWAAEGAAVLQEAAARKRSMETMEVPDLDPEPSPDPAAEQGQSGIPTDDDDRWSDYLDTMSDDQMDDREQP